MNVVWIRINASFSNKPMTLLLVPPFTIVIGSFEKGALPLIEVRSQIALPPM